MRLALTELRLRRAARPLTERWRQLPVQPRGAAKLGISFRPLQATALGLDPGMQRCRHCWPTRSR